MLHVFFLNYHEFTGSSGVHIHPIASRLPGHGIAASVFAPGDPVKAASFGPCNFKVHRLGKLMVSREALLARSRGETVLIHAWTPREKVRNVASFVSRATRTPYIVHLEDNEVYIAEHSRTPRRGSLGLGALRGGDEEPARLAAFLGAAAGITYLIEALEQHCPEGRPRLLFRPACEEDFFALPFAADAAARSRLGLSADEFVIFYPGNVHRFVKDDVAALYAAIAQLSASGMKVRLLRAGTDHVSPGASAPSPSTPWLVHLGEVPATDMPRLMSCCDAVVQPGGPSPFNDYRFPSKIPMTMAAGRPLVLALTNVGRMLEKDDCCLLLGAGDAEDIAAAIQRLVGSQDLRMRLAVNGRAFARRHFNWDDTVGRISSFYRVLAGH